MTEVNNLGHPIYEEHIYPYCYESSENSRYQSAAIAALCEYLNVEIYKTNATKHGNEEVKVRKVND